MAAAGRLLKSGFTAALAALALAHAASPAQSQSMSRTQSWPQRAVKFILPLGPGSGVDISARLLADKLSTAWRQSVVIENRPGGDAFIAISAFASANDDHVLLMSPTSSFTAHPWLHRKLPYRPEHLVPIARISNTVVAVAVPSTLPVKSVSELFAMARAQPGKLNFASITGMFDFLFAGFLKKFNLDIAKVPYRDTVQAANDLAEGRIQLMLAAIAIMRPFVQSGRVKLLAVTAHERTAIAPNVPTTLEEGFPDLAIDGLTGLFGPRKMPAPVRERIAADVRTALGEPEVRSRLHALALVVNPGSPAELADAIAKQRAQVADTGRLLGITPAR
jgi:tripartite-type tricarboxylate transporter receptor subunit TctC